MPLAQLFSVPSTVRPAGSAAVFISAWPGGRAAEREGRVGGEAPRIARRAHHLPAAALELHLDHRHAMRRLRLAHLLGIPGLHAVGVQQAVVGVLVVHDQQAMRAAAVDRVVMHAVVVHAHLHRLVGGAVAGVGLPRRHVSGHTDRLAPGREGHGLVAFGHDHRVLVGAGDALETEQRALRGRPCRGWRSPPASARTAPRPARPVRLAATRAAPGRTRCGCPHCCCGSSLPSSRSLWPCGLAETLSCLCLVILPARCDNAAAKQSRQASASGGWPIGSVRLNITHQ